MQTDIQYNFTTLISNSVKKFGKSNALGFIDEGYLTYEDLGQKISAVQAFLAKLEINAGDKVIMRIKS